MTMVIAADHFLRCDPEGALSPTTAFTRAVKRRLERLVGVPYCLHPNRNRYRYRDRNRYQCSHRPRALLDPGILSRPADWASPPYR